METNVTLESLQGRLDQLIERQERQQELFTEMTPILREVMATATARLDDLEKRGWLAFARELGGVGAKVLDHYRPEDVRALGDTIVTLLDTVRALTQPPVLAILGEAAEGLAHTDGVAPIGLVGAMRASRDDDVKKGLGVLMDLLRHVGRAAKANGAGDRPTEDRKARLARALGPRRAAPVKQLPAKAPPVKAAATFLEGIPFGADGHLADPALWTRTLAEKLAALEGITLGPDHWKVIDAARAEFDASKVAPNIRRLTQISGMATRDLFALFPRAPGRTIARIAGTPKPAGCI